MTPTHPRTSRRRPHRWLALAAIAGTLAAVSPARAQTGSNPVYLDDSTRAAETIDRLDRLLSLGNAPEAVRALQALLDEEPHRVVPARMLPGVPDAEADTATDDNLSVPVRTLIHSVLLANPDLLARYRAIEQPRAADMLAAGAHDDVERTRLLTPAGFEAALRVAQLRAERGAFASAGRILDQLERHPDRLTEPDASDAAALAAQLAALAPDPSHVDRAERWARDAGLPQPVRTPPPHYPASPAERSPLSPAPNWDRAAAELVAAPLLTAQLTPSDDAERRADIDDDSPNTGIGWTLPLALGDELYTNDGSTITRWDRFTLRPVWRFTTEASLDAPNAAAIRARIGRQLEDANTLAAGGRFVIATTGLARTGERRGDGRVHAIDRATGARIWSVDPAQLDDALANTTVRGPVVVTHDTVIVALRKVQRSRRLLGLTIVGLDLASGRLRWMRPVASAGALPYQQYGKLAETMVVADDTVYRAGDLGAAAAIDVVDGRPLWVRRLPPALQITSADPRPAWEITGPIIDDDSLVLLSPDRASILRLDRATGAIHGRRAAHELGDPNYILRAGDALVTVGADRVTSVPITSFETAPPAVSDPAATPGFRGRIIAAGDRVLAPVRGGVLVFDPLAPRNTERVELDHAGNALPLDGQLVVADDSSVYSYLRWSVAANLLQKRIDATPDDPTAAATFAELAYRAEAFDRIAPAVDAAIRAIETASATGGTRLSEIERVRTRLFDAVRDMTDNAAANMTIAQRDTLIDRLSTLAVSDEQRVAHRIALGRLRDEQNRPAESVAAYQAVLTEPTLAHTRWRGRRLSVRADLEATRRLADLLARTGPEPYANAAQRAYDEAAALPAHANPETLITVAQRYPLAPAAARLWMRAAEMHESAGDTRAATIAWQAALETAERLAAASDALDDAALAEITGRLATALRAAGRGRAAADVLARLDALSPGLTPTTRGNTLGPDILTAIAAGAHSAGPLPVLGRLISTPSAPTLIPGSPMTPLLLSAERPTDHALFVSAARAELLSIGIDAMAPGGVVVRWRRPLDHDAAPVLLRDTQVGPLVMWPRGDVPVVELLSPSTGEPVWQSPPLAALFTREDRLVNDNLRLPTPLDGNVDGADLLVAADGDTLIIAERRGHVAALDTRTGRPLWATSVGLDRLHDIDAADGLVVLGGALDPTAPGERETHAVVALDLSTGESVRDPATGEPHQPLSNLESRVRWVRLVGSGRMLAGLDTGVTAVDLLRSRVDWTSAEPAMLRTTSAWLFGDRLFLLGFTGGRDGEPEGRNLAMIHPDTGRVINPTLENRGRLARTARLEAFSIDREHVAFAGQSGVMIYDRDGKLVGADALDGRVILADAARAHGVLLTVEPSRWTDNRGVVRMFDAATARLLARAEFATHGAVRGVRVLDGRVLVDCSGVTIVLDAPPE